jgi:hypothetical protein
MDLLRTIPADENLRFVRTAFALPLPGVPRHIIRLTRVVLKHRDYLHVRNIESIILYRRPHTVRIGDAVRGRINARCEIVLGPAQRAIKTTMRGFTGIRYGHLVHRRWRAAAK